MSNLISNYEISVWGDVYDINTASFKEERVIVIGASDMMSDSRAINPRLKRGINGTNELSFDMYYHYRDNITGEEVDNVFTTYLSNETKIKLKKDDKWFDFIIKDVQKDSNNKMYKYQATD
jgi:hypothetical protein